MRLGLLIRRWRATSDLPVRSVARQIGISTSTLSRIERGEKCDGETMARVVWWAIRPDATSAASQNGKQRRQEEVSA